MSYQAPTVTSAGLVLPSYNDIIAYYIAQFQALYGSTVYLGNDSADFQFLSILALAAADGNAALQLTWNNMSPALATGTGQSLLVGLNKLARKIASFSTCQVTLSGTAGAVISNGVVQDINGNLWNLPASVTIGGGGTVVVTATAQVAGAINITATNQITTIVTPTAGWVSVNNGSFVAVVGQPVETDSQLRQRQAVSTELPSETLGAGTIAAILAVSGVTRMNNQPTLGGSGTTSFENFTGSADSWGNPAHSISPVVQGGADLDVATAIYDNRGLGVLTNGSTGGTLVTVAVTDPNSGITININFARPALVPIFVTVNGHPVAGGSLTAAQIANIRTAVAAFLNSLQIGQEVNFADLVSAASLADPTVYVRTPLNFGKTATPTTSTDVPVNFYEVAQGIADGTHIVVNSV